MEVYYAYGLGNSINGWLTMFSIDRNTKIQIVPDYDYGRMDEILDKKYIYYGDINDPNINKYFTFQFLVLKTETNQKDSHPLYSWRGLTTNDYLNNLFNNDVQLGFDFNPDAIADEVKTRYLSAIDDIIWSDSITEAIKKIDVKENSLAISVRTWKAPHETNIDREYDFETYRDNILKVLDETKIKYVYFSIDNENYKQPYIDLFEKHGIEYIELNNLYNDMTKIQITLLKIMTLAKCDYFIAHGRSTFSLLVFWLSRLRIKTIPVFSEKFN